MEDSDEPGQGAPPHPVDLASLVEHAVRLSQQLEEVWSSALDETALDEAQQDVLAEWSAVLTSLHREVDEAERHLAEAGIDPQLAHHPHDLGAVATFQLDAGVEQRWQQLQTAQLIALENLARAAGALTEPSGKRVRLQTGVAESWWEAGAFGLVRSRALLVLRVTREVERGQALLLGEEPPSEAAIARDRAYDALDAARIALTRGDPDAALLHAHTALRVHVRAALTDATSDVSAADRPGALLARVPSLAEWAEVLQLLDAAAAQSLTGDGPSVDVTVPLARVVVPLAREVIRGVQLAELVEAAGSEGKE
jgi:HEPN domain-containing protein